MEPDWSNLPRDILEAISKKITSIEDYLRLRAVCTPWRSALSPAPHHLPPQFPWFMLPYDPLLKEGNDASLRFFYDISTTQIRQINLPETCGKQYCGSSRGWLVLEHGPEISLLNPITRVQMQLPSMKIIPAVSGASGLESKEIRYRLDIWPSSYNHKGATDPIIQKIILTSSPLDPDCIIMVLFKSNWGLAFCRIGDESWTLFEMPGQVNGLIDATYHNGMFYCVCQDEIRVYDSKGTICEVSKIIVPLEQADYHLIEGEVEELLLVAQHRGPFGLGKRDEFSIYKLGIDEGDQPNWIEVKCIGERICFICEGIEQCFTFPVDNLQMSVLGPNLLSYADIFIIERHQEDYWGWHLGDKYVYDIKMVKLSIDEVPIFTDYWKNLVIFSDYLKDFVIFSDYWKNLVKSFDSYPGFYSLALWITPSFY